MTGMASMTHASALRVLIVEDENRMRDMLRRAVSEMGFEPAAAQSAEQASKLLGGQSPPEIILLDLNLPGMDGLELLRQLRGRDPAPQVIVLTGFGSLDAAKVAIRHDVVDFLTKPCRLDELETALSRAQQRLGRTGSRPAAVDPPDGSLSAAAGIELSLEELERQHIFAALERHHGNRSRAAAELGISERTLYYRLARYARGLT